MDPNDLNDDTTRPMPGGVGPNEPVTEPFIVEATPVPTYDVDSTPMAAAVPGVVPGPANAPTQAVPVVGRPIDPVTGRPVAPAAYPTAAPVVPVYRNDDPLDGRNAAWPYFLAVVALLVGGLVGYLLSEAGDDDDTPVATAPGDEPTETLDQLLERTRADGEYVTPSEWPQMDEITEIDSAAAVAAFTADLDELAAAEDGATDAASDADTAALTQQVADLETALAEVTAERDALAEQVADAGSDGGDQQEALDDANDQIADLEAQLATATADLEAANASLGEAEAALETAVEERNTAVETVEDLNILPNPDFRNVAVTEARNQASTNRWTIIETPVDSATLAPGTVVDQAPPAGSNMIEGSVLYVTVAERP